MSLKVVEECLGCGVCEIACPPGAIRQSDDFRVAYVIDPLACNDCGACLPVCPVDAIVEDTEFAVCRGRGCPLTSKRLGGWSCSEGAARCGACGAMLWRRPGEDVFACPRCDGAMRVACPKVRRLDSLEA